jgi:hypothetical protein
LVCRSSRRSVRHHTDAASAHRITTERR